MPLYKLIISFFLLFSWMGLQGQDLYLDSYLEKDLVEVKGAKDFNLSENKFSLLSPKVSFDPNTSQLISPVYLPEFARNNPTGYTYLCRLELKIEKDLPLGLWLDIGDTSTAGNPSNANANVRFRFKLK